MPLASRRIGRRAERRLGRWAEIPGRGAPSYTPVAPSMRSRIMSAWPLWRAYSSIMWT